MARFTRLRIPMILEPLVLVAGIHFTSLVKYRGKVIVSHEILVEFEARLRPLLERSRIPSRQQEGQVELSKDVFCDTGRNHGKRHKPWSQGKANGKRL
jgi:hypothetical protein